MYVDTSDNATPPKSHTISVLVENRFGVLARVASLFSGRGYNIESLTVSPTLDPKVSRMTIVTRGDESIMEQIDKQLNKLIDVITVTNLSGREFIERELVLFKVQFAAKDRDTVLQMMKESDAKIVADNQDELGVEVTGNSDTLDAFMKKMSMFKILEMTRSGRVAISKNKGRTETYQVI